MATWSTSPRGAGWLFGANVTHEFMEENKLDLICRAHQLVHEGESVGRSQTRHTDEGPHTKLAFTLTLLVAGSWLPLLVAGGLFTTPPPLDILSSNGLIFKIQTAFDSTQRDLHLKKIHKNIHGDSRGVKTANCRYLFDRLSRPSL